MRKIKIGFINVLVMFSICLFQSAIAAHADADAQKIILDDINAYRVKHGLSQLKMNDAISIEAKKHSRDMALNVVPFGHELFKERMRRLFGQFKRPRGIAENVAYTSSGRNADELVKLWLNSPGHRRNIEGNYNLTGIGVVQDKNGSVYATQIFLRAG